MPLIDVPLMARLQEEFRLSMKRLLGDLLPQPKPAGAADPPAQATGKISF